jgi:hypothetical protein
LVGRFPLSHQTLSYHATCNCHASGTRFILPKIDLMTKTLAELQTLCNQHVNVWYTRFKSFRCKHMSVTTLQRATNQAHFFCAHSDNRIQRAFFHNSPGLSLVHPSVHISLLPLTASPHSTSPKPSTTPAFPSSRTPVLAQIRTTASPVPTPASSGSSSRLRPGRCPCP